MRIAMTMRRKVIYAALLVMAMALWCFTHSDRAKVSRVSMAHFKNQSPLKFARLNPVGGVAMLIVCKL